MFNSALILLSPSIVIYIRNPRTAGRTQVVHSSGHGSNVSILVPGSLNSFICSIPIDILCRLQYPRSGPLDPRVCYLSLSNASSSRMALKLLIGITRTHSLAKDKIRSGVIKLLPHDIAVGRRALDIDCPVTKESHVRQRSDDHCRKSHHRKR